MQVVFIKLEHRWDGRWKYGSLVWWLSDGRLVRAWQREDGYWCDAEGWRIWAGGSQSATAVPTQGPSLLPAAEERSRLLSSVFTLLARRRAPVYAARCALMWSSCIIATTKAGCFLQLFLLLHYEETTEIGQQMMGGGLAMLPRSALTVLASLASAPRSSLLPNGAAFHRAFPCQTKC